MAVYLKMNHYDEDIFLVASKITENKILDCDVNMTITILKEYTGEHRIAVIRHHRIYISFMKNMLIRYGFDFKNNYDFFEILYNFCIFYIELKYKNSNHNNDHIKFEMDNVSREDVLNPILNYFDFDIIKEPSGE